jgi:enoyl-CoA hydratase/carnithine racemase
MSELIIEQQQGLGIITLNRPNALNAINLSMVRDMLATLKRWQQDDQIQAVLVEGAGEKAFCAGGDIRTVHDLLKAGDSAYLTFFAEEFELNQYIYTYPKPYIALMTGYVMGGGMGISQGASFRIVTPSSKISMPEVGIGYFPDVGGSYFLARCPDALGLYLGITGTIASGEDTLYANLADWILPNESMTDFVAGLSAIFSPNTVPSKEANAEKISNYLLTLGGAQSTNISHLEQLAAMIEKHFSLPKVPEILASLEAENDPSVTSWKDKTLEKMRRQSPLSMMTTQRLLRLGQHKTMAECFEMEFALLKEWMPNGDFLEGVRALLIDKDHQPKWRYQLSDDYTRHYRCVILSGESLMTLSKNYEEGAMLKLKNLVKAVIFLFILYASHSFAQVNSETSTGNYYLVVSGFSKHFNADPKYDQNPLNEKNWGLGLEYQFAKPSEQTMQWLLNIGEYRDSLNTNAFYAGGAGFYEVYRNTSFYWQIGLQAAYFQSPSYNSGNGFLAVLPAMSLGTDKIAANVVIAPRFAQWMDAGVVYLQLKLKLND